MPASKWQWLIQLSLADNDLHTLPAQSLAPLASSLRFLTLSSNLFTSVPESLSILTQLVALDLSNCMIESLQSLSLSANRHILGLRCFQPSRVTG